MGRTLDCDVAIVGGGLAGGLIALALAARRPEVNVWLVGDDPVIGGNHIWSFFDSDIGDEGRPLVAPLIAHSWQGYHVLFPGLKRRIESGYNAIESERLDATVRAALPADRILTGRRVLATSAAAVVLDNGQRIEAQGVIDARGPADLGLLDLGWQKFVGRELLMAQPHQLKRPIVMDATVAQEDGYRFVYCLPLGPDRLFVEDTYYSDSPVLDEATISTRILDYAAMRGWTVGAAGRTENGVLPIAMGGDFEAYWRSGGHGVAKAGMRAGLFHPTTGYSLPDAVATALEVARQPSFAGEALHAVLHGAARRAWQDRAYYRMLSRMLFRAGESDQRYRVLQRFYRLDRGLIERFHAARSTVGDRIRLLAGRPPVPLLGAMRAILSRPSGKAA